MSEKRLFKEFKQLQKSPASKSNPQIIELAPVDAEKSIFEWRAIIVKRNKHDSLFYYNGQWQLDIVASGQYPIKPPQVVFSSASKINHPNINLDTGEICLDILKDESWSPAWNLESLVGAVLMLIDEPEPESPLNVDSANLFRSDKLAFESAVQHTMWKYNTFFDKSRRSSGVKDGVKSESEEGESDENCSEIENGDRSPNLHTKTDTNNAEQEETKLPQTPQTRDSHRLDNGTTAFQRQREKQPKPKKNGKHDKNHDSSHFSHTFRLKDEDPITLEHGKHETDDELDYIHDLGRHITQEFLKKATEVQISTPRQSSHDTGSSHQLAAVHQLVSNNVARQIEQICSKHPSRAHSPTGDSPVKKEDISFAENSFMEKIDQQVDEIRRLQERQSLS